MDVSSIARTAIFGRTGEKDEREEKKTRAQLTLDNAMQKAEKAVQGHGSDVSRAEEQQRSLTAAAAPDKPSEAAVHADESATAGGTELQHPRRFDTYEAAQSDLTPSPTGIYSPGRRAEGAASAETAGESAVSAETADNEAAVAQKTEKTGGAEERIL